MLQEFKWYSASILRVVVVAIDASKVNRTTIDLNQAALQFNGSKPDWLIDDLQSLPFGSQADTQVVQIRMLRRPFQWTRKFPHPAKVFNFPWYQTIYLRLTGSFTIFIGQLQENFRRGGELDVELYLQESIPIVIIQLRLNEKVFNVTLNWDGKEGNIPKNSYEVDSASSREVSRNTDRTATDENTGVSMPFSSSNFQFQGKSKAMPASGFQRRSHNSGYVPNRE